MGMSASQARYLALTARKTNTEWEGQQINQARTALANQSANLFNQLLALEVPNAPKTTDYTELQYSYSDGDNKAVIDEWEQLSNSDPDYNYVVNRYYNAKIYTGSKKHLQDPQVHIQKDLVVEEYFEPMAFIKDDGSYSVTFPDGSLHVFEEITTDKALKDHNLAKEFNIYAKEKGLNYDYEEIPNAQIYGYTDITGSWHFNTKDDIGEIEALRPEAKFDNVKNSYSVKTADGSKILDYQSVNTVEKDDKFETALKHFKNNVEIGSEEVYAHKDADETWHFSVKKDLEKLTKVRPEVAFDPVNNGYIVKGQDGVQRSYTDINDLEFTEDLETALKDFELATGIIKEPENEDENVEVIKDNIYANLNPDGTWHFFLPKDIENPKDYSSRLTGYVGNSRLSELLTLSKDQAAELAQILKDCDDTAIKNYLSFDAQGNLVYDGQGVYTFDMNGKTYFTTAEDLNYSMSSPHEPDKPIDLQNRLVYYNATYVDKRIESKNNAMIQKDENGRFVSVKFDDDSVVYSLNVETVTDDDAYKDAMNEYSYKKEQYEKTIADINAQTSIIQQEDRTLELRLKQLDTEQNALATEMDSVKKVIKDNVEKVFKTFND